MKCAKAKAQAELGGERAAVVGGAEQPDLGHGVHFGLQAHADRCLPSSSGGQLPHLLRKVLGVRKAPAAHRLRGAGIAAWGAPDAEVDAPGVERLQHAEGLRGAEGAVVGQQHAAGADAHAGASPRPGARAGSPGRGRRARRWRGARRASSGGSRARRRGARARAFPRCARRAPRPLMTGDWSRIESFICRRSPDDRNPQPFQRGDSRCDIRRRAGPTKTALHAAALA